MINSKFILMYHVREFEVTNNKVEVDHEVQPSLSSEGSDAGLSPRLGSDMRESFLFFGRRYGRQILLDRVPLGWTDEFDPRECEVSMDLH